MKTNQDSFGPSSHYPRMREVGQLINFIARQSWLLWVTHREIIINASWSFPSRKTVNCLGSCTEACSGTCAMSRLATLSTGPELKWSLRNPSPKASALKRETSRTGWSRLHASQKGKFPVLLSPPPLKRGVQRKANYQKESDTDQQAELGMCTYVYMKWWFFYKTDNYYGVFV